MLTNNVYQEERIPTQFERFWRSYRANGLAMFGLWCLVFIVLITIFAPLLAPFDAQA
ncbi:peptide ABC transporter permease, partial [Vibrio parahaemolyticus]|nr:peptide ABC transporter permease [Vibrio parahaemolyticus]